MARGQGERRRAGQASRSARSPADIKRAVTATGTEDRGEESVLGNFIADVQLAGTSDPGRGGAQIAFMNPGGLRADLLYGAGRRGHLLRGVLGAAVLQRRGDEDATRARRSSRRWRSSGSRPALRGRCCTWACRRASPTPTCRTTRRVSGSRRCRSTEQPIDPTGTYRVTVELVPRLGRRQLRRAGRWHRPGDDGRQRPDHADRTTSRANSPVTADPAPRSSVGQPGPTCDHDDHRQRYNGPLTVSPG